MNIKPDGSPNSRIAIIGARPGRNECETGRGFTGQSGELLWRLLGIPRSDCYVTNVRKDFSFLHSTPTRAEIHEALPSLREELEHTSANILICLGADALYALSGRSSIEQWRGSIIESNLLPGRKLLATYHPAATLHTSGFKYVNYSLRYVIEHDLRRAKRESAYPDIRRPQRTFFINPPFDEAISLLRGLSSPIAVDIETFGNSISCLAISDDPSRAICIAFIGGPYTTAELVQLWRELDVVFRTRETEGQNFQFDTTRLEGVGFRIPQIGHDTMLSHHLLWTELGSGSKRKQGDKGIDSITGKHSLAFISSIYTDEPYYKHESELAWSEPNLELGERLQRYWTYNCKDACVTRESSIALRRELKENNQEDYYYKFVLALIRPIMRMQANGMCVDLPSLNKIKTRLQLEANLLQAHLDHMVGFACNVRSTADIRYLLFDVLKYTDIKQTKKGAPSTDEETLRTLAYKGEHPEIFRLILDIRERRTLISGFLNLETDNGRYKASYLIHGTDSGRLSSRAVAKGPQLQNIPKSARKIFVPSPGCVFVQGDLSRAEAMFVAYDAQEENLIKLFEDASRDLYKEVAASSLGTDVDHIRKESIERDAFKQVVLGSNYKMGPLRLVNTLRLKGIDIMKLAVPGFSGKAKAEYVQSRYFTAFPGIRRWQKQIWETGRMGRVLVDAFGRRRVFLGKLDEHTHGTMCSYPPQATVVGIANQAIIELDRQGWPIVAQVHDSVMVEAPKERRDEAALAVREAMTKMIKMHGRPMTIPVEITWSETSWGDMKLWIPNHENDSINPEPACSN